MRAKHAAGRVSLVGAGPGDPDLITVKGRRCIRTAEVVVHDRLVDRRLIELAPPAARRIDVGKAPGNAPWSQSRIQALLVAEARRGRRVVRLKGGDPFVFGRGGEECEALARAGIEFEVVPGLSSSIAAPAHAGIPVTHRGLAHTFTVVTGHMADDGPDRVDWAAVARSDTVIVLMGLARLSRIVRRLREAGRTPDTRVAVIERASSQRQRTVRGTLADIVVRARVLRSPATIVVGPTVGLAERIAWREESAGGALADLDGFVA